MPDMIIEVSNDNQIEVVIKTVGRETFRYYPQPLKASMLIGLSAGLTFFEY